MPRPQLFDELTVVQNAMHLFWAQGYVATGMAQILKTSQLKPGSFYQAFGNKKALFIRAIEHYNREVVAARIKCYLEADDPLDAISNFFYSACEDCSQPDFTGCLLTNTATEIGKSDPDIDAAVWAGLQQIESALRRRIKQAQGRGLIADSLDPKAAAQHLLGCYQGMSVVRRLTRDKTRLRNMADLALHIFK